MKRFTEKHYHGIDHYLLCSGDCHADMDCVDCPAFENAVERLAAYEDTGLEPEQVEALKRQKWIPCSERLPEEKQRVLFWVESNEAAYTGFYSYTGRQGAHWFMGGKSNYAVKFWMPLPEPPEEGGNENAAD